VVAPPELVRLLQHLDVGRLLHDGEETAVRDGSEQTSHGSSSVRAWQTEQARVLSRASASADARPAASIPGAARR